MMKVVSCLPGDDVAVAAGACWLAAVPALGLHFAEQRSQQPSLRAGLGSDNTSDGDNN